MDLFAWQVCHSKSGDINPQKIQQLVEGYVNKFQKQRSRTGKKDKSTKTSSKEKLKANGERSKSSRWSTFQCGRQVIQKNRADSQPQRGSGNVILGYGFEMHTTWIHRFETENMWLVSMDDCKKNC